MIPFLTKVTKQVKKIEMVPALWRCYTSSESDVNDGNLELLLLVVGVDNPHGSTGETSAHTAITISATPTD